MFRKMISLFFLTLTIWLQTASAEPMIYCDSQFGGFNVEVDGHDVSYRQVDISFRYDSEDIKAQKLPLSTVKLDINAGFIFRGDADYKSDELSLRSSKLFKAQITGTAVSIPTSDGRKLTRDCAFDVKEIPSDDFPGVNLPTKVKEAIYGQFKKCFNKHVCPGLNIKKDAFARV